MRKLIGLLLTCLISATAHAELVKSTAEGFIIKHSVTVARDIAVVFQEMTGKLDSSIGSIKAELSEFLRYGTPCSINFQGRKA